MTPPEVQQTEWPFLNTLKSKPNNPLIKWLTEFDAFGKSTLIKPLQDEAGTGVLYFINEFWTARQRQAHPLHEISYRACFKPQLPAFFIDALTQPGDVVYDPFMGRGTTPLEAALKGRVPYGCDINPLSECLVRPRLQVPSIEEVADRLETIDFSDAEAEPEDLLVFYHPDTLRQISALRRHLRRARTRGLDPVDDWIQMVALNRLTGHSPGFFSVYTMPPNQAVSVKSQRRINERRNQVPPPRDVAHIILKKTRSLLSQGHGTGGDMRRAAEAACFLTADAADTPQIASDSVALVVTSPPFLDVVDYATDNWLRCWFLDLDASTVELTVPAKLAAWEVAMGRVFVELKRVLKPGGYIAFEVGEVRKGKIRLEEAVLRCGAEAGLKPLLVMINDQTFTKTANCWGVNNNTKGTNTNRIVVFHKES